MFKTKIVPRDGVTDPESSLTQLHQSLNRFGAFVAQHLRRGRMAFRLVDGVATVYVKNSYELSEEIRDVIEASGFSVVPPEAYIGTVGDVRTYMF